MISHHHQQGDNLGNIGNSLLSQNLSYWLRVGVVVELSNDHGEVVSFILDLFGLLFMVWVVHLDGISIGLILSLH